jgi:hypothetical protein
MNLVHSLRRTVAAASVCVAVAYGTSPGSAAENRHVMAGRPGYDTSAFHNLFMGSGYRKLWVTPIDFEVLDLKSFAGGLTPVRQVGSMQSIGLAMKGADGRSYTFRTSDKDPTRILPPEWAETVPAQLFQDATAANHPGVGFVVPPLAEAAGVLHTNPRYVFMPDDPVLGEFRKTFGGQPGTIEEFPVPGTTGAPGFAGATEILSTGDLWKRHLAGEARIDEQALLRARLFDLWIQDWDRHNKQWRWLQRGKGTPFEPLPEDRDQAFSRFGGLLLATARGTHPKFMDWKDHYTNFEGWMTQGGEVDRWMLSGVPGPAFEGMAKDLVSRLSDEVIDGAVGRLPPSWFAIDGAGLAAALKKRRDGLVEASREYYRRLAGKVDVHGTDLDDTVQAIRGEDGRLEIAISQPSASAPWFRRSFDPGETSEVRVYLYRGADQIATSGPADGPITLRVVGGPGPDRLDDSKGGGTRFYDPAGGSVVEGSGTRWDTKKWTRQPAKPAETPWLEWRDWGSRTRPVYQVWWEPDPQLMLAAGLTRQTWGFRKSPYSTLQTAQLQYSVGRNDFKLNYDGEFRRENSKVYFVVDAQASQLENLNYFGTGNDSTNLAPPGEDGQPGDDSYYDVDSDTYDLFVSTWWAPLRTLHLYAGPDVKLTDTPESQDGFTGATQPYGVGQFGQAGVKGGFDLDTRGHRLAGSVGDQFRADGKPALSGVRLKAEGFYYPEAWDSQEFGGIDGTLRGYLVGRRAMLAARFGGRQVWGDYPWFEAAFVGGSKTDRGFRKNRFAGDASLYGSLEARLWLFRGRLIAPGRWGVFGLVDTGRVFVDGEDSDTWHTSWGGGIFFQMATLNTVLHAAVAHGDEGTRFRVGYGFGF